MASLGRTKPKKTIELEPSTENDNPTSEPKELPSGERVFKLKSGKRVKFKTVIIPHNDIIKMTNVDEVINGRDQSQLTKESLAELSTIKDHQFFPAIGTKVNGKINILDGSRRRAAALLFGADLEVLVSEVDISTGDAKKLAKDIQTAKEHNLREIGLRLQKIQKELKCNNQALAEREGLSETKVSKALQAADVSNELLKLFRIDELFYPDYKYLLTVTKQLEKNKRDTKEFCSELIDTARKSYIENADEAKKLIMGEVKANLSKGRGRPKTELVVDTLVSGDRNQFIKRKTKGRMVSYEFSRMPVELIQKIESEIAKFNFEGDK